VPHVLFLSGAQHNELVPEISVGDRPRGALSTAFANALSGLADENRDRVITGGELGRYVLRAIRALSDSGQHPNVQWPHPDVRQGAEMRPSDPLFFLDGTAPALTLADNSLRLQIRGMAADQAQAIGRTLPGVNLIGPTETADLTWDAPARDVLDRFGNTLASGIEANGLQAVVDGVRATDQVRRMVMRSGLDMRLLLPGEAIDNAPSVASDRTHRKGARITMVASQLRYPHFALFNITGDGTIQFLYPRADKLDPVTVDASQPYQLPLVISEPFGADHAVAIASGHAVPELIAELTTLDGKKAAAAAIKAMSRVVGASDVVVGMQGIFTTAK
jgi:hypothetical protein